jgi:hypothetical protein
MHERRDSLATALIQLPDSLRARIITQMGDFAGDPVVAAAINWILQLPPFHEGALGDVDEGAGRLLQIAAIAAPDAAMAAIERVLSEADHAQLQQFGPGRRGMVHALEVLAWFAELFDRTADALLRLAITKNETWANNATGILQRLFAIFLGGTSAPYEQRLAWATRALQDHGEVAEPILVEALGHAFAGQEFRTATHFGGRTAPVEWRPKLVADEIEARGGAWDLLIQIAHTSAASADRVAKVLANGLATALSRGLSERMLHDLRAIAWSASARAELGDAVAKVIRYEAAPPELASDLRALEAHLQGSGLSDRVGYALSLSPWRLMADDEEEMRSGRPHVLRGLADELAQAGRTMVIDAAIRSRVGDAQTAGLLFEDLAGSLTDETILAELEALDPVPAAALLGFLTGLAKQREQGWVDVVLERWLVSPSLAGLVITAVHLLPATEKRAQLAVEAVDRGISPAGSLGRFVHGAWTRPLPELAVVDIVARLAAVGDAYEIESGLGILHQWLDAHKGATFTTELQLLALGLIEQANQRSDRGSSMIGLYRSRVLQRLGLPFDQRLRLVIQLLRSMDSFPRPHDLELVDALVTENAEHTVNAILELLGDDEAGFRPWLLWLDHAKLLSRLERVSSPELVIDAVTSRRNQASWSKLVDHIDFSSAEPDPLMVALLDISDHASLRGRASVRFMYPETAWWGSEAAYLRARGRVAKEWAAGAPSRGGYRAWLDELAQQIEQRVASVEIQEAEQEP